MDAATLIRTARRASGLSQTEYAALVGVRQPVISAYENGRREPSLPTLERLVAGSRRALRIDLVWNEAELPRAVGDGEHASRLLDVLSLADAIPRYRTGDLQMPRISSAR
jgi:transcriptional regulator with XRE-family HTH domain